MRHDMLSGPGGPLEPMPDDTACCNCGDTLRDITESSNMEEEGNYFAFEGFCGPRCAALYLAKQHSRLYTPEFMNRIAAAITKTTQD